MGRSQELSGQQREGRRQRDGAGARIPFPKIWMSASLGLFLLISLSLVLHLLPFIRVFLVAPLFKSGARHGLVKQETPSPQVQCWLFPAADEEG